MTGRSRIRVKRIYEAPTPADGTRILVDRLWPRGVSKEAAALDRWMREVAPSDDLRTWFGHDPSRWTGFVERYEAELDDNAEPVAELVRIAREGEVTLLFSARDDRHNQAVALAGYLMRRL